MPTITVADHAGACYGVQRALGLVQKVALQATGPVHTLGPLIHNPQVVKGLASQGVTVVDDVPTQAGSTLVLRTHGVVPQVEQAARDFGLDVVDATCPYVETRPPRRRAAPGAGVSGARRGRGGAPRGRSDSRPRTRGAGGRAAWSSSMASSLADAWASSCRRPRPRRRLTPSSASSPPACRRYAWSTPSVRQRASDSRPRASSPPPPTSWW